MFVIAGATNACIAEGKRSNDDASIVVLWNLFMIEVFVQRGFFLEVILFFTVGI